MRLDELCAAQYPEHSPAALRSWIAQGKVQINGAALNKAGTPVLASSNVVITAVPQKFVCRQDLHFYARGLQSGRMQHSVFNSGVFQPKLPAGSAHSLCMVSNKQSSGLSAGCETALSCPYRAGLKLEAALNHFQVDVSHLKCLDAGISTGGFSDCLLQRGAASVIGVDVGYGQV